MPPLAIGDDDLSLLVDVVSDCHPRGPGGARARSDPLAWLATRGRRAPRGRPAPFAVTAGVRRSTLLDLASNDYLGLARDPRVVEGGATRSRTGAPVPPGRAWSPARPSCTQLEADLADHMGCAAALTFSSGYLANLAAVTALAGAGDPGRLRRRQPRLDHRRLPALPCAHRRHAAPVGFRCGTALVDAYGTPRAGRHRRGVLGRRRPGPAGRAGHVCRPSTARSWWSTRRTPSASSGRAAGAPRSRPVSPERRTSC